MTPTSAGSIGQAMPREGTDPRLLLCPQAHLPLRLALLLLSLVLVRKCITRRACHLCHLSAIRPCRRNSWQRRPIHMQASLFLSLAHPFPFFGSGICLSGKAGMSFLNCVYLLALWCESAPRQLHINLVSSLYLFSSASLPWPNLWLSFPLLPIVTVTGNASFWVLGP